MKASAAQLSLFDAPPPRAPRPAAPVPPPTVEPPAREIVAVQVERPPAPPARELVVSKGPRAPRPYQIEAVEAVEMQWESGVRSTLIVMPTATGKTRVATEILARRKHFGRSLFIAQREELIRQAEKAISNDAELTVDVEMAENKASVTDNMYGARSDVVVASVQSLHEQRLKRWPRDSFATIFIDEGHHATSKSHLRVIDRFPGAKICGLTATPDRGDDVGLKAAFETCAYNYEIRTAIQDGWIVPIRMLQVFCADLDIAEIKTVRGDLSEGDLEQALTIDSVLHQIAAPLVREAGNRPTIVFTAGVAQAHALAGVLAAYTSARIASADGETNKVFRREIVEDFKGGKIQFLVNCGLWLEGFDAPATSCIAMARPTKSRALMTQCIGRGFRLSPETGKSDLLVLDFVGNSGRHKLVSAMDVLAGKDPPTEEVRELADGYAKQGMDLEGALSAAEREAERRRKLEEEMKRAKVQADVAYRTQKVDPFGAPKHRQPFEVLGMEVPTDAADVSQRATKTQMDVLKKYGIDLPKVTSRSDASKLLGALFSRRKKDLCTYKQARALARAGLRTNLYFADAKKAMDALVESKWHVTPEIWEQWGKHDEGKKKQ